jgi:hypothetical protein
MTGSFPNSRAREYRARAEEARAQAADSSDDKAREKLFGRGIVEAHG